MNILDILILVYIRWGRAQSAHYVSHYEKKIREFKNKDKCDKKKSSKQ